NYSFVFLLSLIAGCSNENTSIIVVLISICHSIYLYKKNNLKFCFFGVIGSIIGASILLLSPGNYSRASTFPGWVDTPLQNKIADHFINRFESTLQVYWQVYMVIAVFMIISACSTKDRHSRNHLVYSFVFLLFSIIANCAFALSPSIPDRALNGSLILTLISASFVFSSINIDDITGKILRIVILSFCAPIFLLSYYLFTNSLFANYYQSQIRVNMVVNDKNSGNNTAYIPSFYFTPLLKASDSIDYFHSPSMSSFFGLSYIGTYSPDFDYSQVRRARFFKGPFVLNNELSIDKIFIYRDTVFSQYRLIAKFNKNTSLLSGNEVYLHINMDDGKVLIADLGNNSLWIDESNISQVPLGFINPEKIQSITYGIYTRQTMKRITERTTNIHGMLQNE
ncbi:hypothetical protein DQT07_23745, partial [Salmonella enterica subsp. enterica serovar Fresno]|nr:hypothetical protein [Salmonella enterica subsp. enterica serovar Fresno]